MNLKEWAAEQGVAYVTARRWFAGGLLPVPAHRVGALILIGEPTRPGRPSGSTVVYARVSSSDQKRDLDRRVARITTWATDQHLPVDRVVTEVGSARSGQRRKFLSLSRDESVATIMAPHRDRFARFGAPYVEAALSASGRQVTGRGPWRG